jgi:tRNA threonylcarbamoyladenosine biosynthesis protein TsaE
MTATYVTRSEEETLEVARQLGRSLGAGVVVRLLGDLGTGKTVFVRGLAEGLGLDPQEVSSPTFTLIQEYRGPLTTLYHADLYRLEPREVPDLALDELAESGGILAVEWAEKLPEDFEGGIAVRIQDRGGDEREIRMDVPASLAAADQRSTAQEADNAEDEHSGMQ